MIRDEDEVRDLSRLVVARRGSLALTGDLFEPYRLVDASGVTVAPAGAYLRELAACGRPAATQRSYGMDLLRWFWFLWAVEIGWDQATRVEARDFCSWIQLADKPTRAHWRYPDGGAPGTMTARAAAGTPNRVTGKPSPGRKYATATVLHCESVLRGFYDFHLEAGSGPMVDPFPLVRRGGRANAHHNPMEPFVGGRSGRYRPRLASRLPRQIPDDLFDKLFARLGCDRDRALVAFWVSTGARAAELLGATVADADPGQQLITVVRKGTRALQQLPASPDAFVWLRLYQARMHGLVPAGRDQTLWWTSRRPFRALTYDAARVMFGRANAALGANWSLHDLRHSAAYRMARDPNMPLTARITAAGQPLQWRPHDFRRIFVTDAIRSGLPPHIAARICDHSTVDTTMGYAAIYPEDVIAHHRAFIARRRAERPSEEYRDLTTQEWDEFLAHFELRKVALGTCGRDHGTPCAHENACVRCPLLRVDPAQIPRLQGIHANLLDRLREAKKQGWLGEVAAIETTIAAATQKLETMRAAATQRFTTNLGMPQFHLTAGRSSSNT